MAAPVIVQSINTGQLFATVPVVFDATPTEGNLIVLFGGDNYSGGVFDTPTDFTKAEGEDGSGFNPASAVFYKVAGPSESNSYTVEANGWLGNVIGVEISGWAGSGDPADVPIIKNLVGFADPVIADVDTVTDDDLVLGFAIEFDNDPANFDTPAGWTLIEVADFTSGNRGGVLYSFVQTPAGSTGDQTLTGGNGFPSHNYTYAIKPGSSAIDVTPDPVVVEARVVAPSVSLRLSPAPVVTNLQVVAPTIALRTSPAPVEVEARVVAPTVTVGGSTIVTPDPVVLIARVVAPTVQLIGRGLDGVYSPPVLHPGQQYGVEPQWLRELRRRRRPPRVDEPRENPDDPAVVRARLDRLWLEQEREEEEWLLGL